MKKILLLVEYGRLAVLGVNNNTALGQSKQLGQPQRRQLFCSLHVETSTMRDAFLPRDVAESIRICMT